MMAHTNFYEKALFVKPTWRPLCGVNATALPFALCFYSHSRGALSLVARCIVRSVLIRAKGAAIFGAVSPSL
jgi:hypothetical protein